MFGDLGKLGILNLTRKFLMKRYQRLLSVRVTAFTVSELLRKASREGKGVRVKLATLNRQGFVGINFYE